jgi:protein tyrosine/serine phosphatase
MKLIPIVLLCVLLFSQSGFGASMARTPLGVELEGVSNFGEVVPGQLYRGAQPTAEGFQQLRAQKQIKTVISLRDDSVLLNYSIDEERQVVEQNGMEFVSVPLSVVASPSTDNMETIQTALTDPSKYPVYIHCAMGEDRTGLSIGLYRVQIQGWPEAQAYQEMIDYGFHPITSGALHTYFHQVVNSRQIFGTPVGVVYDTTR